ncbi:MAG: nucleotidyltransferase family protein [Promethearchaeota archaeon]|nr:MAG: nucleotidyltransferase family protein [Candidatus Lokiarchaeota archaeon]
MVLKAVILCAGYGTRMRPYTNKHQKTMVPLHGKPLLEYIIKAIKSAGFFDFILVVGYRKDQIFNHFGNGKNLGINIEYVEQNELNGTGGALLLCEQLIEDTHFFLTWGDTLVARDTYEKVHEVFKRESPDFILVANHVDDPYKGAAIYCKGNYCSDIIEKPPLGKSKTNLNNAGVFILSKEIFEILKVQQPSARGEIEVPEAIRCGLKERSWKIRIVELEKDGFYGDCGDLQDYEALKRDNKWLKLV